MKRLWLSVFLKYTRVPNNPSFDREDMLTQRDLEIAEMQERIASMSKDKKVQEEELAKMVRINTDLGVY